MTIQQVNLGTYANDGTGDDLRTAFDKVNKNFVELYGSSGIVNGVNLGPGAGLFKDKNGVNLEFRTLTSDASITITTGDSAVNLVANTNLANDPMPTLTHNLNLNGHIIGEYNGVVGSQVQTRIWNYDIQLLASQLELLTKTVNVDFGSFVSPTPTSWPTDFGSAYSFIAPPDNKLDFGKLV